MYEKSQVFYLLDLAFEYKRKKKDPAASYLRRGKPNYCRRESA